MDSQVTLWNREEFLKFLIPGEDAWEFEQNASRRSADSGKIILWHYMKNDDNPLERIVPYDFRTIYGYGITWGGWLWKNREWFEKHGITNVNYSEIGILSEKLVSRRIRFLYKPNRSAMEKFIGIFWNVGVKAKKIIKLGPKNSIKKLVQILEKSNLM